MNASQPTKVLIVDDSAVVRQVLTALLQKDPAIRVIGSVADPIFAMERMNREWPDVVVLDIEMPRMDGITFLKKLMAVRPTPVVICSTLTEQSAKVSVQAMAAGALGMVTKPTTGLKNFLEEDAGDILGAVKAAAAGNMRRAKSATLLLAGPHSPRMTTAATSASHPSSAMALTTDRIVAIGTSTGGTQALEVVLRALPRVSPGIVVVQHMPEKFTAAFAARLNSLCEVNVAEASNGDRILQGRVLIAPGGLQMSVERDGAQYRTRVGDGPRVNRHKPSVDVLFNSVAKNVGSNALGVIMTGMGDDGARGLLQMRQVGAQTVGQNEGSCVVYGMPRAARELGAVEQEIELTAIAAVIQRFAARA